MRSEISRSLGDRVGRKTRQRSVTAGVPVALSPSTGESQAGGLEPGIWKPLGAALSTVRSGLAPAGTTASDELHDVLARLERALRAAIAGEEFAVAELGSAIAARRLLDQTRSAFVENASCLETGVTTADVLRVLQAMERVQAMLDADAAQRFASRLAAPDALELLVEVAHDMRSPLSAILFLAERLRSQQSGPITQMQERQLGLMYGAAFGLSSLASDVIALARGGEPLVEAQPIPFAVSNILHAVREILQPVAEQKGLTLIVAGTESDVRVGHPAALQRTLLNLATNALKFTASGSVEVRATEKSRTRVEFSVKDTGRGIPDQVLATLFEAFRQRQSHGSYAFSSAGLGLSICQKLIAAMGGELKVETKLEKGTRFSFELELPVSARL